MPIVPNVKLSDLTLAGKLLLLLTIAVVAAAGYYSTVFLEEAMPGAENRQLRAISVAVLTLGPGLAFFFLSAFLLRLCGIRAIKSSPLPDNRVQKERVADIPATPRQDLGPLRRYRVTTSHADGQWVEAHEVEGQTEDEATAFAELSDLRVLSVEELPPQESTAVQPGTQGAHLQRLSVEALPSPGGTAKAVGPELWNPDAAVRWSKLLTPAFGAYLQAANWRTLGKPERARANMLWMFGTLVFLVAIAAILFVPGTEEIRRLSWFTALSGAGALFFAWKYTQGRSQVRYVDATLGNKYVKKRWTRPVLVGLVALAAYLATVYLLVVAAYEPGPTEMAAEMKPMILREWRRQPSFQGASIQEITLARQGKGVYTGFVRALVGGRPQLLPVDAVWDHGTIRFELKPPAQAPPAVTGPAEADQESPPPPDKAVVEMAVMDAMAKKVGRPELVTMTEQGTGIYKGTAFVAEGLKARFYDVNATVVGDQVICTFKPRPFPGEEASSPEGEDKKPKDDK